MKKGILIICVFLLVSLSLYAGKYKAVSDLSNDCFILLLVPNTNKRDARKTICITIPSKNYKNQSLKSLGDNPTKKDIGKALLSVSPFITIGSKLGVDLSDENTFYFFDFSNNLYENRISFVATDPQFDDKGSVLYTCCQLYSTVSIDGEWQPYTELNYDFTSLMAVTLVNQILTERTYVVFTEPDTLEKQRLKIEVYEDSVSDVLSDLIFFMDYIY